MKKQLRSGLSHREQSLSSPTPERLRAWRLYFESALALTDVLDAELERDADIPLRWYDVLVKLEETPDGLRMNELAERILYSKSGLTRVVDRMEEACLVRRVRPDNDRRSIFVLQRGRSSAPLGKANLISESVIVRMRNSDPDSVCNQYASDLHIVAIRARHSIPHYPRIRRVISIARGNPGEKFQPRLLAIFLAFAAELFELGENGTDIEFSRLFLRLRGGGDFSFLARRRFSGREEGCASINR